MRKISRNEKTSGEIINSTTMCTTMNEEVSGVIKFEYCDIRRMKFNSSITITYMWKKRYGSTHSEIRNRALSHNPFNRLFSEGLIFGI